MPITVAINLSQAETRHYEARSVALSLHKIIIMCYTVIGLECICK